MAKMLWLNWSGGGNLPPSLGIARALTERGHTVTFAGRPEMISRVQSAGFRAMLVTQAYAQVDRYPPGSPVTKAACYLTSPAVEAELAAIIEREAPEMLLIDCMFPAAHNVTRDMALPKAMFCHTFFFRFADMWRNTIAMWNGMREKAGFSTLPGAEDLWKHCDRIIVTTAADFDTPINWEWEQAYHAGPVLEDETCAVPVQLPWPASDARPLVLVSFSTAREQRSADKIQRTLQALAPLDVRVVVTTGGIVSREELDVPENAAVFDYAQHDALMKQAALVIAHGGHGTTMRTLKNARPLIVIPGLAGDQAPISRTIQEWGAGLALPSDADVDAIRKASATILSSPSYTRVAERLSRSLAGVDGAANAANEIELLLHEVKGKVSC
jgi:UDP:flavonoid glycosyltransferase YjiC (YdhE family)